MTNLQVELAEVEEVMPTLEYQQQVSRGVDAKWKTRQRLRNLPRKEVEKLIKDVYHTICGPPCEELHMPECIRALPRGMESSTGGVNRGQWTRKSPAPR